MEKRRIDWRIFVLVAGFTAGCGEGPIEIANTVVSADGLTASAVHALGKGALPVDIAVSKAGDKIALVVAGRHGRGRIICRIRRLPQRRA